MKISAAARDTGATPATAIERIASRVQISLLVSRRLILNPAEWQLNLQSPFWRLYVHDRVGATINTGRAQMSLKPGWVYLIPAWVRFKASTRCELRQDYTHFFLAGIPPTLTRKAFHRPISIDRRDPRIAALVDTWQQSHSMQETDLTGLLWAGALVQVAVAASFERLPVAKRQALEQWAGATRPFGQALQRIEQQLERPPSNKELADCCGQSTDHFIRGFKAAIGLTPARYGIERRIAVSTQWLIAGGKDIESIARDVGFADRFHYSRVFRKLIGMPPAAFRAAHAGRS